MLRVKATVDTSQIHTDPLADGYDKGLANLTYFLDIFTPLREQLSEESGGSFADASARLQGSQDAGAKAGTATSPRALGFEQILASDYNEDKFPAPGEWYVSLNAADSGTFPADVPAELPVELDVEGIGHAQASSADFAKALPGPQKQRPVSPDTSSGPERLFAATDEPADPALTLALVAVIALVSACSSGRWPWWCWASGAGARSIVAVARRPIFVVQKHAARTLHYDVRLEVDGVLKSWAVPKGPSTDPREKRLAVAVEDHALDYADFEGTIGESSYGAGAVIVWDTGPYRNRTERDGRGVPIARALAGGHAVVELEGRKLRGRYALTRTGEQRGREQWLLVKVRDEAADARRNPVSTEPESVLSGRTIEDVAAGEE